MNIKEAFQQANRGCTLKPFGKKFVIYKIDNQGKAHLYDLESKLLKKLPQYANIVQTFPIRPDDPRLLRLNKYWGIDILKGTDNTPNNPLSISA